MDEDDIYGEDIYGERGEDTRGMQSGTVDRQTSNIAVRSLNMAMKFVSHL